MRKIIRMYRIWGQKTLKKQLPNNIDMKVLLMQFHNLLT